MKNFFIVLFAVMLTVTSSIAQTPQRKPLPLKPLPQRNTPQSLPANNNRSESLGASLGNSMVEGINSFGNTAVSSMNIPIDGYPNISLLLGLSRYSGEFVRAKWNIGGMGGFALYGSVGKDYLWNLQNKNKLAWNVGLGYYFAWESEYSMYANNAFDISVAFGETPLVPNYGVLVQFEYEHWFGDSGRVGVFGSAGLGLGDTKNKNGEFIWDLAAGITIKLWQK